MMTSAAAESTHHTSSLPPPSAADRHPTNDLLAGTAYRTCAELGQGSMGDVVVAEHETFGRVVVKILRAELANRSDLIDRMRLEARVLALIAHPNTVRLLDFSKTPEGRPFIVMEHLTGTTLRAEMDARVRFPIAEAVSITRQTLSGLSAAHAVGILHRDIKPANLFLAVPDDGSPRTLKVLDFGVAKVLADSVIQGSDDATLKALTAPGAILGTPRYLSPEQIRLQPLDARADLYAVGLILYAMLVGKGPFDDLPGFSAILQAHLEVVPPPPSSLVPGIPPRLDSVVMKAIAKRREGRFENAEAFIAALDAIIPPGELSAATAARPSATDGLERPTAPTIIPAPCAAAPDDAAPARRSLIARLPRPSALYGLLAAAAALLIALIAWAWARLTPP